MTNDTDMARMFGRRGGRLTAGAQLRAARALLGWSRQTLATAAKIHRNAVAYWEAHESIPAPPLADTPHACREMMRALAKAGVVMVSTPGPGAALNPPDDTEAAGIRTREMLAQL